MLTKNNCKWLDRLGSQRWGPEYAGPLPAKNERTNERTTWKTHNTRTHTSKTVTERLGFRMPLMAICGKSSLKHSSTIHRPEPLCLTREKDEETTLIFWRNVVKHWNNDDKVLYYGAYTLHTRNYAMCQHQTCWGLIAWLRF